MREIYGRPQSLALNSIGEQSLTILHASVSCWYTPVSDSAFCDCGPQSKNTKEHPWNGVIKLQVVAKVSGEISNHNEVPL